MHETGGRGTRLLSVCLYTPSFAPSGMGTHMLDLADELAATADVCIMACATPGGGRLLEHAVERGLRTVALPLPRSPSFADAVTTSLLERPADVFHVHVGTGFENFDGARAARRAQVRAVVQTLHLPWLLRSRRKRRPFFRAIAAVDKLIAVSKAQRATYVAIGVPEELLVTVPNGVRTRGVTPGRAAARAALGLEPRQQVLMTAGRLTPMKGQRYLVDAMPDIVARFPEVRLVLLGTGHLHEDLRRQAAALDVERHVYLLGHREDARMLLDAADVFVLPSLHEGMPMVVLEAMDAGLPVVATDTIGTAEVVVDGVTGLLVRPRDSPALGAALTRLLVDPGLRNRLGDAGRQRYLQHFTSAHMARRTSEVYRLALTDSTVREGAHHGPARD